MRGDELFSIEFDYDKPGFSRMRGDEPAVNARNKGKPLFSPYARG